jgi:hypothetical protein
MEFSMQVQQPDHFATGPSQTILYSIPMDTDIIFLQ